MLLLNRDVEPFFERRHFAEARICVQSYVTGMLANCAISCWQGELLASVAVEVLQSRDAFGMATVVRRTEGEAMVAAASSIARHLGLSGFCGFDFILDRKTGRASLIEINPRATQINHFPNWEGVDLPTALFKALSANSHATADMRCLSDEVVTLFPQEWLRDPTSEWLSRSFHDVPFEEPELLRYYGYQQVGRGK